MQSVIQEAPANEEVSKLTQNVSKFGAANPEKKEEDNGPKKEPEVVDSQISEQMVSQIAQSQQKYEYEPGDSIIENPNFRNFMIYWYYAKGDLEKSQMHLDQWKAFTCENYEFGHWIQALIHRQNGRLSDSLKYFKLCHVLDSENPDFLKQIAKTLKLLGRFKIAFKVANDALQKAPNDWELYYLLAGIKENQGDYNAAKDYLNKASIHSRNRQVVLKFGAMHVAQKKNDFASTLLLKFAES